MTLLVVLCIGDSSIILALERFTSSSTTWRAYAGRGLCAESFVLLLQRMDPEYSVIGRVRAPIWERDMSERYGANARRQMMKLPHPDIGPFAAFAGIVKRYPHYAASAVRALCTQLTEHERLRRGDYHADRRICPPGQWPSGHHQTRGGLNILLSEPMAGQLSSRSADGSRGGGRVVKGVRPISERGGVRVDMDTMYQRGKIQDERPVLRTQEVDGSLPLIGVKKFSPRSVEKSRENRLIRSTPRRDSSRSAM